MQWNPDIGIPLAVVGLLLLAAVAFLGRPGRGERAPRESRARREPKLGFEPGAAEPAATEPAALDTGHVPPLPRTDSERPGDAAAAERGDTRLGARPDGPFDRIVTLYVAARAGRMLHGSDLVVAAEKAGLVYGHRDIFHRLVDGHPEQGPIFSVANLLQPGHFDLERIGQMQTPGIGLFMTLPGPLPALDAWETLLPTAQRLAELLDAVVLDEDRNALGRQTIAHLRDQMRAYDRKRERENRPRPW